jgi:hypothetical protein
MSKEELSENVDSQLIGIFDLIRSSPNDAGHPASGGQVGRDAVYGSCHATKEVHATFLAHT